MLEIPPPRPIGDETPGDLLCEWRWLEAAAAAATAVAADVAGGDDVGLAGVGVFALVAIERGVAADAVAVAVEVVVVTWALADRLGCPFEPGDEGDEEAL